MLNDVKANLGITGTFQDKTIIGWIKEVESFLIESGIDKNNINVGIVTLGVKDLWNYGSGNGELSPYFYKRATQLAFKKVKKDG